MKIKLEAQECATFSTNDHSSMLERVCAPDSPYHHEVHVPELNFVVATYDAEHEELVLHTFEYAHHYIKFVENEIGGATKLYQIQLRGDRLTLKKIRK